MLPPMWEALCGTHYFITEVAVAGNRCVICFALMMKFKGRREEVIRSLYEVKEKYIEAEEYKCNC